MTMTRLLSSALLAATAITFVAPATAQQIDRIVAFGDSYADDNNAFGLGYNNPGALAVYPTGRFSGGTNYIDTLSILLQAPIENFAIGGAFGGTNNGTLCYDPPFGNNLCGKGLQYEVDQFLNVGTQSGVFPTGTPTFGEGDLLAVSIGGNDSRFYQQVGGSLGGAPAAGTAAAAGTSLQLDRLVAAGAPTISFLAGDTGRLPEIAPFPTLAAIRSAYSATYNAGLRDTLSGYAADGVIVHYLDLGLVLDNIAANPGAYGITNPLCPLFPNTTCVVNAGGYLFYGDALHLTTDGFKIVANYVATQLTAPLTLQASSDLGLDIAHQFGRTLSSRMDLGAPRDGDMPEGIGFYIVGDTLSRGLSETRTNDKFKTTTTGLTVGAEAGFGAGLAGIAINRSRPKANFTNDASSVKGRSTQVGVYASAGIAGGFVQAYAGYGWDKHDLIRRGVVQRMTADIDGNHTLAGIKAGYLMPMGDVRVGPVVALDYARAKVDGYTETGDPALTLNVDKLRYSSLRGSLGAEIRGDFGGNGLHLRPFGAAVIEKDFKGDDRTINFSQTSAPTIVNHFQVEDGSKKAYGRFSAGFSAGLASSLSVNVTGSATVGKDQGNETSAHLGFRAAF